MILPNKYVEEKNTLLYAGALLLQELNKPISISNLWNQFRNNKYIGSYERFIMVLDMLFILGIIELEYNKLVLINHDS